MRSTVSTFARFQAEGDGVDHPDSLERRRRCLVHRLQSARDPPRPRPADARPLVVGLALLLLVGRRASRRAAAALRPSGARAARRTGPALASTAGPDEPPATGPEPDADAGPHPDARPGRRVLDRRRRRRAPPPAGALERPHRRRRLRLRPAARHRWTPGSRAPTSRCATSRCPSRRPAPPPSGYPRVRHPAGDRLRAAGAGLGRLLHGVEPLRRPRLRRGRGDARRARRRGARARRDGPERRRAVAAAAVHARPRRPDASRWRTSPRRTAPTGCRSTRTSRGRSTASTSPRWWRRRPRPGRPAPTS